MSNTNKKVVFTLFCLGNPDSKGLAIPEGSIIFQYIGFPIFINNCIFQPVGPTGLFSTTGITAFDNQYYSDTQAITEQDIPSDLSDVPKVKDCLVYQNPNPESRRIANLFSLAVGEDIITRAFFIDKNIVFERLGRQVMLDCRTIPDRKRFTLVLEWDINSISIRLS